MSLSYLPAILKNSKHGWQIEYHALDPVTGKLKRHVTKLNALRKRYPRLTDFKAHCNTIICNINTRLAGGWTPFGEMQNTRMLTPLKMVAEDYLKEKEVELRPDTMRSYRSFCKGFTEWSEATVANCQIGLFNRVLAVKFMDHCFYKRNLHGRSWNNQLKAARAFFSWAVEKCYAKENPFSSIKPKREDPKKRILIPHDARSKITGWCEANRPNLIVVLELVFTSLIRPKEVRMIRVEDVYLDKHYIFIKGENAKTHFERFASLSPELETRIRKLIEGASPGWYLIGDGYAPGPRQITHARFRKDWDKIRKDLQLPQEMQLYSFRDTGINEMLKSGIDPLTVMQHADHHDLSMTTRYANHADPHLVETIKERAPQF